MKFTCTREDFNKGINISLKAVPGKTTMPILECVMIEALDGQIKFTTNDMQLAIETLIPAEVNERGVILVNAKMIADIVRKLPDERVEIEVDDRNNILIFCGKSKFNLPGKESDEFPPIPDIKADKRVELSQFTLKEMIRQTIFSISSNESNKLLTGELFEINGDDFRIASLDLFRVSIRKIKLSESYEHIKVVIPGKTLIEISKILSGESEDTVNILFSKNHVIFELENTMILSRLIEGNFFNIDQMIKDNYETKVRVNKQEFYGCIDRSTLLLKEIDKNPVILNIKDDEINLELKTSMASMDEDISVVKEGSDIRIGMNPKYLIDVLRVIDDEEIDMYYFNSNSPCFIKNKEESYIYVVLPINI